MQNVKNRVVVSATLAMIGFSAGGMCADLKPLGSPNDKPHQLRRLPELAPPSSTVQMHLRNGVMSLPKDLPSGVLQDIVFYNGIQYVPMHLRAESGYSSGLYARRLVGATSSA